MCTTPPDRFAPRGACSARPRVRKLSVVPGPGVVSRSAPGLLSAPHPLTPGTHRAWALHACAPPLTEMENLSKPMENGEPFRLRASRLQPRNAPPRFLSPTPTPLASCSIIPELKSHGAGNPAWPSPSGNRGRRNYEVAGKSARNWISRANGNMLVSTA